MKSFSHKFFSLLLAVVMCLSIITTASAAEVSGTLSPESIQSEDTNGVMPLVEEKVLEEIPVGYYTGTYSWTVTPEKGAKLSIVFGVTDGRARVGIYHPGSTNPYKTYWVNAGDPTDVYLLEGNCNGKEYIVKIYTAVPSRCAGAIIQTNQFDPNRAFYLIGSLFTL